MTTWAAIDMGVPSTGLFSVAFGASADGSVIVGSADFDGSGTAIAFSWTSGGGFVNLGLLASGTTSQATGVSADGTIVVGLSDGGGSLPSGPGLPTTEAFRWTSGGGMVGLGFLGTGQASQANAISADGTTIVGTSSNLPGYTVGGPPGPVFEFPFVWTSGTGMFELTLLAGDTSGTALAVSADGSVVVGVSTGGGGDTPVVWVSAGAPSAIPFAGGATTGEAFGVSSNGVVTAGGMTISGVSQPFLSSSGTTTLLGEPFLQTNSSADGISADGLHLVGHGSGSSGTAGLAWHWTLADGFEDLPPLLGDSIPSVTAISLDGTRPVGNSQFTGHAVYWAPVTTNVVAFDSLVRKSLVSTGSFACGPIPLFPTLPQGFPVKISPEFDTTVGTTKSLREMRVAQRLYPLWDFEIVFMELRDQTQNQTPYAPFVGFKEYEHLVQLWLAMYGQTGVFAFDAPWDNSRAGQSIGAGDGVKTAFTIVRVWGLGSAAVVAPIGMINQIFLVQVNGITVPPSGYSVGRNTIYFNVPPGAGLVITLTFSYYYLCRFVEDEQDFEEFGKNRWTVPTLKFRAVNWV